MKKATLALTPTLAPPLQNRRPAAWWPLRTHGADYPQRHWAPEKRTHTPTLLSKGKGYCTEREGNTSTNWIVCFPTARLDYTLDSIDVTRKKTETKDELRRHCDHFGYTAVQMQSKRKPFCQSNKAIFSGVKLLSFYFPKRCKRKSV